MRNLLAILFHRLAAPEKPESARAAKQVGSFAHALQASLADTKPETSARLSSSPGQTVPKAGEAPAPPQVKDSPAGDAPLLPEARCEAEVQVALNAAGPESTQRDAAARAACGASKLKQSRDYAPLSPQPAHGRQLPPVSSEETSVGQRMARARSGHAPAPAEREPQALARPESLVRATSSQAPPPSSAESRPATVRLQSQAVAKPDGIACAPMARPVPLSSSAGSRPATASPQPQAVTRPQAIAYAPVARPATPPLSAGSRPATEPTGETDMPPNTHSVVRTLATPEASSSRSAEQVRPQLWKQAREGSPQLATQQDSVQATSAEVALPTLDPVTARPADGGVGPAELVAETPHAEPALPQAPALEHAPVAKLGGKPDELVTSDDWPARAPVLVSREGRPLSASLAEETPLSAMPDMNGAETKSPYPAIADLEVTSAPQDMSKRGRLEPASPSPEPRVPALVREPALASLRLDHEISPLGDERQGPTGRPSAIEPKTDSPRPSPQASPVLAHASSSSGPRVVTSARPSALAGRFDGRTVIQDGPQIPQAAPRIQTSPSTEAPVLADAPASVPTQPSARPVAKQPARESHLPSPVVGPDAGNSISITQSVLEVPQASDAMLAQPAASPSLPSEPQTAKAPVHPLAWGRHDGARAMPVASQPAQGIPSHEPLLPPPSGSNSNPSPRPTSRIEAATGAPFNRNLQGTESPSVERLDKAAGPWFPKAAPLSAPVVPRHGAAASKSQSSERSEQVAPLPFAPSHSQTPVAIVPTSSVDTLAASPSEDGPSPRPALENPFSARPHADSVAQPSARTAPAGVTERAHLTAPARNEAMPSKPVAPKPNPGEQVVSVSTRVQREPATPAVRRPAEASFATVDPDVAPVPSIPSVSTEQGPDPLETEGAPRLATPVQGAPRAMPEGADTSRSRGQQRSHTRPPGSHFSQAEGVAKPVETRAPSPAPQVARQPAPPDDGEREEAVISTSSPSPATGGEAPQPVASASPSPQAPAPVTTAPPSQPDKPMPQPETLPVVIAPVATTVPPHNAPVLSTAPALTTPVQNQDARIQRPFWDSKAEPESSEGTSGPTPSSPSHPLRPHDAPSAHAAASHDKQASSENRSSSQQAPAQVASASPVSHDRPAELSPPATQANTSPSDSSAVAPAPTSPAPVQAPPPDVRPPQLPHPMLPLAAKAAGDDGLNMTVMPHAARMSIESSEGDLAVHLRVRDGSADVTVGGSMAPLFETRAPEARAALASEGLNLGRFDLGQQGGGRGGGQQGQPGPEPPERGSEPTTPYRQQSHHHEATPGDGRIHVTA